MKTRNAFLFLFLTASVLALGQKPPAKFGDISMEDMTMKVYLLDSSASAVILADYGDSRITYMQGAGFNLTFDRITRIKILKKEGFDWANFQIPLYVENGKEEGYSALKASTYNLENGKIVETKLKNDAVFKEQTTENWKQVKFALPNVKEGSVVEVSYKISSPFWFNFQDWEFQSKIPTRVSEYRAKIPEYFKFQKFMQGYVPLDINESSDMPKSIFFTTAAESGTSTATNEKVDYQENNLRLVANHVPAFKEEPFMNSYKNYISKINFELANVQMPNKPIQHIMGSWEEINNQFLKSENFGRALNGSGFLKDKVEELTIGKEEASQKIASIYNYVKGNVEWDGTYRRYTGESFRKILEQKKGSSAEINLLLTSMLQKAGLSADPVLISTRSHGTVRENFPLSSQFNYVICLVRVNDKTVLLDATDRSLPMNLLPERCLNGKGFIISEENNGWIDLTPNFKSKSATNLDLSITEEGILKGKIILNNTGYDAQRVRSKYYGKGEAEYLKQLSETNKWELQKTQLENFDKLSEPVKETYEATLENYVQNTGGVIYVTPILKDRIELNPFRLEKREYPVDFTSPFEKVLIGKIAIPDGYKIDEMPQTKVIMLPNNSGKYTYNISQLGNSVSITSILSINKTLFTQEEYSGLREFYNQVVAKQAEQIVLKKK